MLYRVNPAEFLTISAAVVPEREALVSGDGAIRRTYEEMASRVNRLANALQARGVGPGSRVAVMATNSPASVETYYACAKLGACYVPLNYRAKQEELAYMLDASEAGIVFIEERYRPLLDALSGAREVVSLDAKPLAGASIEDLIASADDNEPFIDVDEQEPTALLFTSGTTALPKGVELTFLNLSLYALNTMSPADPEAPLEKTLVSVGIYHIAGLTAILSSIWGGRTLVTLPQFEPDAWLAAVQRERVTHAFVVPTMLKRLMETPSFASTDISSLRLLTYGAAPMPFEVVRRAIDVFSCDLMNAYGQTESTSALTYLGPDDHRLGGSLAENERRLQRLRSVGRAMDDIDLAILDDAGRTQPSGAEGEICVRSARVMKEYLKQGEATAAAIVDGWLHTGDRGHLDEDGYLFITGRVKDLIIRGGENISPGEIEAVIESHDSVEEAAVIGAPDAEWGEVVKAVVVPASGAAADDALRAELQALCRSRLSSFKAPAYIAFVDALPRNPMGKVLKTDLRRDHGGPDNE